MTNPTPRPALRKAEDATVHPAAPRPVRARRTPAAATLAPSPPAAAAPAAPASGPRTIAEANIAANEAAALRRTKAKDAPNAVVVAPVEKTKSKKRKFSGSTTDHLRMPDADVAPALTPRAPKRVHVPEPPGKSVLMTGKSVDLDVKVPKKLRSAANAEAKKRGLDLDAVTAELLHTWLTGR